MSAKNSGGRTRTGCFTCRKRHKRCDEVKPVCTDCKRLNKVCEYPEKGQENKNKRRKKLSLGHHVFDPRMQLLQQQQAQQQHATIPSANDSTNGSSGSDVHPYNAAKVGQPLSPSYGLDTPTSFIHGQVSPGINDLHTGFTPSDSLWESVPSRPLTPSYMRRSAQIWTPEVEGGSNELTGSGAPRPAHLDGLHKLPPFASPGAERDSPNTLLPEHSLIDHALILQNMSSPRLSPLKLSPMTPNTAIALTLPMDMLTQSSSRIQVVADNVNTENNPEVEASKTVSTSAMADANTGASPGANAAAIADADSGTGADADADADVDAEVASSSSSSSHQGMPMTPTSWLSLALDEHGMRLFEYFSNRVAPIICAGPAETNSYLQIFVPLAHENVSVLSSLVTWGAVHKGEPDDLAVGRRYKSQAVFFAHETHIREENNKQICNRSNLSVSSMAESCSITLACYLALCAAEICGGDVINWKRHLKSAASIIRNAGGLQNFVTTKTMRWLIVNFAYHDALSLSLWSRAAYFSAKEYEVVMNLDVGPESIFGSCKPVILLLTEVSELTSVREKLDTIPHGSMYYRGIRELREMAVELDAKIENCHPDIFDMVNLDPGTSERQLTLFEIYKISARLYLFQAVRKLTPSCLDVELLCNELIQDLDIILGIEGIESPLVYPMFIAAVSCRTEPVREEMRSRFKTYFERNKAKNIMRALELAELVWFRYDDGEKHVDWYSLISGKGWDICFA